jgi:hypothetical protein
VLLTLDALALDLVEVLIVVAPLAVEASHVLVGDIPRHDLDVRLGVLHLSVRVCLLILVLLVRVLLLLYLILAVLVVTLWDQTGNALEQRVVEPDGSLAALALVALAARLERCNQAARVDRLSNVVVRVALFGARLPLAGRACFPRDGSDSGAVCAVVLLVLFVVGVERLLLQLALRHDVVVAADRAAAVAVLGVVAAIPHWRAEAVPLVAVLV